MSSFYTGKILKIDLSSKNVLVDYPEKMDKNFYRKYWGGSCLGAYYLFKELKIGSNPFSPENIIIFATSAVTGVNVPGFAKFSVISKSPLTNLVSEALCDGFWGTELKLAGYDAIVIKGKSKDPVYILITDGKVNFKSAAGLWGKEIGEATEIIKEETGDNETKVACIGPAGENKVRFANIISDYYFASSKPGFGAIMGSKNIKAIAVRGSEVLEVSDPKRLEKLSKKFHNNFTDNFINKAVFEGGTASFLSFLNNEGLISSKNAQTTFFEGAKKISGEIIQKKYNSIGIECRNCPAACHRIFKDLSDSYNNLSVPELETLMSFGNGCNIDNLEVLLKANALCNKYGLDATSTGVTIAFVMECFERKLLDKSMTGNINLKFGNGDIIENIINKIIFRQGIGNIMAEGTALAAKKIGKNSENFAMQVKGQELPLHDPRTKAMLGLSYLISPTGPDDLAVEHDTDFDSNAPDFFLERVKTVGILERMNAVDLNFKKVRMLSYLQLVFSFMDNLCLCKFAFAPCRYYSFTDMVEILNSITGWEVSLWELMKAGERRLNMFQVLNLREGYNPSKDKMPERIFEPILAGPKKGVCIQKNEFYEASNFYYQLRNWDSKTGWPAPSKLIELDLEWLVKR